MATAGQPGAALRPQWSADAERLRYMHRQHHRGNRRGTRCGVRSETTMVTANAIGTVHAAGWASSTFGQPDNAGSNIVVTTAAAANPPPTTMPATTPTDVSRRHHTPSNTTGQNAEAAMATPNRRAR